MRELQFRRSGLLVSILSKRRAVAPWGAAGGGDGARGLNLLLRAPQNCGSSGLVRTRVCAPCPPLPDLRSAHPPRALQARPMLESADIGLVLV